jgi:hypothetical protein
VPSACDADRTSTSSGGAPPPPRHAPVATVDAVDVPIATTRRARLAGVRAFTCARPPARARRLPARVAGLECIRCHRVATRGPTSVRRRCGVASLPRGADRCRNSRAGRASRSRAPGSPGIGDDVERPHG